MHSAQILSLLAAVPAAMACLGYEGGVPEAVDSRSLSEPQRIKAGETFDAGWVRYDRGVPCTGQSEGGEKDAVFILEDGATIRNVIIGADQGEGIYCLGSCNVEFAWFEEVCEDAISLKGDGIANIIGGGAYGAQDKVYVKIQVYHSSFRLWRSHHKYLRKRPQRVITDSCASAASSITAAVT